MMQYPSIMQPTHARWERVPPSTDFPATKSINGTTIQKSITDIVDQEDIKMTDGIEPQSLETTIQDKPTIFTPVNPIYTRNYLVVDTLYESPPTGSTSGIPGPDGDSYDVGFNGLSSVSEEIRNLLPEECRVAFEKAVGDELAWKGKWAGEAGDGMRAGMVIHKGFIGPP